MCKPSTIQTYDNAAGELRFGPEVVAQVRKHSNPQGYTREQVLTAWLSTLGCEHSFVATGNSLKYCRVAQGQADIYPRLAPTSTAAAKFVLEAADGVVLDVAGEHFLNGLQQPLLNQEFVAVGDKAIVQVTIGIASPYQLAAKDEAAATLENAEVFP